jgi:hypothetical protein
MSGLDFSELVSGIGQIEAPARKTSFAFLSKSKRKFFKRRGG